MTYKIHSIGTRVMSRRRTSFFSRILQSGIPRRSMISSGLGRSSAVLNLGASSIWSMLIPSFWAVMMASMAEVRRSASSGVLLFPPSDNRFPAVEPLRSVIAVQVEDRGYCGDNEGRLSGLVKSRAEEAKCVASVGQCRRSGILKKAEGDEEDLYTMSIRFLNSRQPRYLRNATHWQCQIPTGGGEEKM